MAEWATLISRTWGRQELSPLRWDARPQASCIIAGLMGDQALWRRQLLRWDSGCRPPAAPPLLVKGTCGWVLGGAMAGPVLVFPQLLRPTWKTVLHKTAVHVLRTSCQKKQNQREAGDQVFCLMICIIISSFPYPSVRSFTRWTLNIKRRPRMFFKFMESMGLPYPSTYSFSSRVLGYLASRKLNFC